MFNQTLQQIARACSRVPTPAWLIDKLLDRIETLSLFVVPANVNHPLYDETNDPNAPRAVRVVATDGPRPPLN